MSNDKLEYVNKEQEKVDRKRKETLKKMHTEIRCIEKLLESQYGEVIGTARQNELRKILSRLRFFENKLEKNIFEISIIGLEKSGKSTFANAFMGSDVLPTKDARCTYTATSIRYGTENDAQVFFYSEEQFQEEFQRKLALLQITDTRPWNEWRESTFSEALGKVPELSLEQKNICNDVEEIIQNQGSLLRLVGHSSMLFSGEGFEQEIKGYIEDPAKALAVKEIVIRSDKLSRMRNAVIYDVPGFDSPTQLHKDQTREWMKKSDAVILIVSADRPSFNDSLVQFFDNTGKDNDGISIGQKLFVFANRSDIASTLDENLNKIRSELKKYDMMPEELIQQRLIAGSAKARIERDNGNPNSSILQSLYEKGISSDGIDDIRKDLEVYNNTVRLQVMQQRIANLKNTVDQLLREIQKENAISESDTNPEREKRLLEGQFKRNAARNIREELAKCRDEIETKCEKDKPITKKVQEEVLRSIDPSRYQITKEDIRHARAKDISGAEVIERLDAEIRDEKFNDMYEAFIKNVVDLATEEYQDSKKQILAAMETGLGVEASNPYFQEIEESLKLYITDVCRDFSPDGYYNSLIRRYSRNLFEILISTPFGNDSRFRKFDEERSRAC